MATPLGALAVEGTAPAPGPAVAVVRPESVRLSPDTAGGATVATVTYYGHDQLVAVALDEGTVIRVRLGAERLFSTGERVRAHVVGPVIAFPGTSRPVPAVSARLAEGPPNP